MNFGELQDAFVTQTGVSTNEVGDASLAYWFNEALLDLSLYLAPKEAVTMEVVAGEKYPMPHDAIGKPEGDYLLTDDNKMVFSTSGVVTLIYPRTPQMFTGTDPEETCDLPDVAHYLLPLYAASRYWDEESEGDGEESAHGTKWMNYYLRGKAVVISRLGKLLGKDTVDRWIYEEDD